MMCMTKRECSLDRNRNCMVCYCVEPGNAGLARDMENRHGEAPVQGPGEMVTPE